MAKIRARGERGSWFADVNGERLPCVHRHWITGTRHSDPGYVEGEGQWPAFLDAIKSKQRVVLTNDDPISAPEKKSGLAFNRTGYIAVFKVGNIEADEIGLRFDLVERVCDLA